MNDAEGQKQAQLQVDTFLTVLRDRYGLSESDISQLAGDLVSLHQRAEFARRMGEWTAQAIIAVLVGGVFAALAWGVVKFVEVHAQ